MSVEVNISKRSRSFINKDGTITEQGYEEVLGNHMGRIGLPNQVQPKTERAPSETEE